MIFNAPTISTSQRGGSNVRMSFACDGNSVDIEIDPAAILYQVSEEAEFGIEMDSDGRLCAGWTFGNWETPENLRMTPRDFVDLLVPDDSERYGDETAEYVEQALAFLSQASAIAMEKGRMMGVVPDPLMEPEKFDALLKRRRVP